MDTGKRLWEVDFRDPEEARRLSPTFKIVAKDEREAVRKARLCLVDEGFSAKLALDRVEFDGTLDEPAAREPRKGARRG